MARQLNPRILMLMFEEELVAVQEINLERRRLRDHYNAFDLPEDTFRAFFRVSRDIGIYLINSLTPALQRRRSNGLSVRTQILVTLRFMAEGAYQKGVGQDFLVAISQPSASRCIKAVTNAMVNVMQDNWLKFPNTTPEKAALEQGFRPVIGFPGVFGAVDCTHIAILSPHVHEESYKNHKGFHSLNVQMVCDSEMRILDITAYPGTVHDQFIWTYCHARAIMREAHGIRAGDYFLIGDSGYALEEWLLTPLPHADEGTPEYRYTRAHCMARSVIERCFGILKARWRCLLRERVLRYQPQQACKIVVACAILHNLIIHHRLPPMEIPVVLEEGDQNAVYANVDPRAAARRNLEQLINRYFA